MFCFRIEWQESRCLSPTDSLSLPPSLPPNIHPPSPPFSPPSRFLPRPTWMLWSLCVSALRVSRFLWKAFVKPSWFMSCTTAASSSASTPSSSKSARAPHVCQHPGPVTAGAFGFYGELPGARASSRDEASNLLSP